MKRPEILSPAGDLERLKFAVLYGADAVYVGATEFGMRSAPKNFTMEQLAEGVRFAHARGRRVYLTLNTVPTNEEIDHPCARRRRTAEGFHSQGTGTGIYTRPDSGLFLHALQAVRRGTGQRLKYFRAKQLRLFSAGAESRPGNK